MAIGPRGVIYARKLCVSLEAHCRQIHGSPIRVFPEPRDECLLQISVATGKYAVMQSIWHNIAVLQFKVKGSELLQRGRTAITR